MGGKGRRAGGRGDALGNLETHRRRSRCRPALRPLHTARSIRTTAARCLPRAPTYSYSYTSPTGRRRRAAAASCARTSARCASSHNRRPVPASVRARLRARGLRSRRLTRVWRGWRRGGQGGRQAGGGGEGGGGGRRPADPHHVAARAGGAAAAARQGLGGKGRIVIASTPYLCVWV